MTEAVKIKEEPIDEEYENLFSNSNAKIKTEPEDDIPDGFFEDVENNKVLDLISNIEFDNENVPDENKSLPDEDKSLPDEDKSLPEEENGDESTLDSNPDELAERIKELRRLVAKRKGRINKIELKHSRSHSRSRSGSPSKSTHRRTYKRKRSSSREGLRSRSRSPRKRRSRSRERKRSHSGSSDRERRLSSRRYSRSKERRRSRSPRGRRSRSPRAQRSQSPRRLRSRSPRSRRSPSVDSRRRNKSRSPKRSQKHNKKISFLDELQQIFAAKGQSFPEKDVKEVKKLLGQKEAGTILREIRGNSTPSRSEAGTSTQFHSTNEYSAQFQNQKFQIPMPITIKIEPMDHNEMENQKPPELVKVKVEKVPETKESRREKVLKMCSEAVHKFQSTQNNFIKTKFLFTSTIIKRSGLDESLENRSPLNQISNVQFKFNSASLSLDLEQWGLWKLSDSVSNVIRETAFDKAHMIDKLSFKDMSTALKQDIDGIKGLKKDGKIYTSFYTDSGTQTDEITCGTCILRQLRKFSDKMVEAKPLVGDVAIQAERDDQLPIMNTLAMLNSSQLIALNDFSELLKAPAPANTNESYRLREKLMDIYDMSKRPCMMPNKFPTAQAPQAPGFNHPASTGYHNQYQPAPYCESMPTQMYPMTTQQPFTPSFSNQMPMSHPFQQQHQPPMHQAATFMETALQPVPPYNRNVPMAFPSSMPRPDDPRKRLQDDPRIRERERDNIPPPAPRKDPRAESNSSSSNTRLFGRGGKPFSSARR